MLPVLHCRMVKLTRWVTQCCWHCRTWNRGTFSRCQYRLLSSHCTTVVTQSAAQLCQQIFSCKNQLDHISEDFREKKNSLRPGQVFELNADDLLVLIGLLQFIVGQGCGLGLDVSVSRRSRDVPKSRLGLISRKIVNISVSSWSPPFTSPVQDQFSAKLCKPQYAV